ncbi:hypothetical protein V8F06_006651 [Rhypophila decipiens]
MPPVATSAKKRRACDACNRRKIQCDGEPPDTQCNWCYHHGEKCTWNRVPRPRGRARQGQDRSRSATRSESRPGPDSRPDSTDPPWNADTESPDNPTQRLVSAEPQVADKQYQPLSASPLSLQTPPITNFHDQLLSPSVSEAGPCFGKLHFAGYNLGDINSYHGIPTFSEDGKAFIRSRTGQSAVFENVLPDAHEQDPRRLRETLLSSLKAMQHPDQHLALPDRRIVEEHVRFFCSSFFKLEFPIVDCVLFRDTVNAAYEPFRGPDSPEAIRAKACVFSFLSVMSLFEPDRQPTSPPVDGDVFATKTHALLPLALQDLNLTVLQTLLMLAIHRLFSGQVPSASLLHSLACRIMFMLGGHTLADPWLMNNVADRATRERRHLRRLFWLCFMIDKEICLRTGQPPAIDDEQCVLTLPEGYLDVQYVDRSLYTNESLVNDSAIPVMPGDLRLGLIKSKACKLLYSTEGLRKSDAELLRDIRELDEDLEQWRLSIPPQHRPVLSMPRDGARTESIKCPDGIRSIVIHFEYHYLIATVHRATSRCGPESSEMEGIRTSHLLTVEASRSTLLYLRFAIHVLLEEAFWIIVFYPMTAATCLFFSILVDPLNPNARRDLDLLDLVPELIKHIRMRSLTQSEMYHLQIVDDFLAELIRLGRCAIEYAVTRARQEQSSEQQNRMVS